MKDLILIITAVLVYNLNFAQVGIGTSNPRGALDVNGNILLEGYLRDDINIDAADDTNTFLLVRSKDSGSEGVLKLLDVSLRNVGPVNKYVVKVTNIQGFSVLGLVTNLPVDKYVVAITDAKFNGIMTSNGGQFGSFSTEVTPVTRNNISYNAINLDYKGGTLATGSVKSWEVSLVVYERELVKDWGTFTGSVSGNSANPSYSGVSTNTPIGLQ